MFITVIKNIRLWGGYLAFPIVAAMSLVVRCLKGYQRLKFGRMRIIGPPLLVHECEQVLEYLQNDSPDVHDALIAKTCLVVCVLPLAKLSWWYKKYCFVGNSYLREGETGIIAFLVYTAFRSKYNLYCPRIIMNDWYGGKHLNRAAAVETSEWLASRNHNPELVRYFATLFT